MARACFEYPTGCSCENEHWIGWETWGEFDREYSCPVAATGMHDWGGFDRTLCYCVPEGTMHTYCTECAEIYDTDLHEEGNE